MITKMITMKTTVNNKLINDDKRTFNVSIKLSDNKFE